MCENCENAIKELKAIKEILSAIPWLCLASKTAVDNVDCSLAKIDDLIEKLEVF